MATLTVDLTKTREIGENVSAAEVDGKLVLVIDPTKDLGPSTSGKMNCVANTGGFTLAPFNMKINVYAGRKA